MASSTSGSTTARTSRFGAKRKTSAVPRSTAEPWPVVANGSMATTMPASSRVVPSSGTLSTAGGQCTVQRPTPWPQRLWMARTPRARMAPEIATDSVCTSTPGPATARAASSAARAASTSRSPTTLPRLTVSAVSTTQPSRCTPTSSFTTSPAAYTVSSSGEGQ